MSTAVIAHRTCPRDAAENSLEGIRRAAELGAHIVELDARCTRDGVPILMHDPTTLRTTGAPWLARWISSETARGLRLRKNGEPVPTLSDALAALGPGSVPGREAGLGVAIDIKDPTAGPAVVDAVRVANVESRVLLWSQHMDVVRFTARAAPDLESALLRDTRHPARHQEFLDGAVEVGARGVSAHWNALSPEFVDAAAQRGLSVYSWCKRRAALHEKLALPLAGIVTDWPSEVRLALAGR
ncbi:MAG: glycerophosphodiester phosphodiesterase [Acidimicrobiia bacterium]